MEVPWRCPRPPGRTLQARAEGHGDGGSRGSAEQPPVGRPVFALHGGHGGRAAQWQRQVAAGP